MGIDISRYWEDNNFHAVISLWYLSKSPTKWEMHFPILATGISQQSLISW